MSNIIVYTASDKIPIVHNRTWPDVHTIYFSRNKIDHPWTHYPLTIISQDSCRNAKLPKINPWLFFDYLFPNWDVCIWIDANMQLLKNPIHLINHTFAVHKHGRRVCIHQEVDRCIKLKKDDKFLLQSQLDAYQNHPKNFGLWECGMIVRKNTQQNKIICDDWWREIEKHSRRDQVSFPIIVRKHQLTPEILGNNIWKSSWVKIISR